MNVIRTTFQFAALALALAGVATPGSAQPEAGGVRDLVRRAAQGDGAARSHLDSAYHGEEGVPLGALFEGLARAGAPAVAAESQPLDPNSPRAPGRTPAPGTCAEEELLLTPARQGDADAQLRLGLLYEQGACRPPDRTQATRWLGDAAEQGLPEAQYALAVRHANGLGVERDPAQAAQWFSRAATQGHQEAQLTLGLLYTEGLGIPRDVARAAHWFHAAAEGGDAAAQYHLAEAYASGRGVPPDEGQAARWYRQAAQQGHKGALWRERLFQERPSPEAQNDLGVQYAQGLGVPRDAGEAAVWFRRAARAGFAPARFNLGLAYAQGTGVPQDDAEAARWVRQAADQGVADAQNYLGYLHAKGSGVARDAAEAVGWYRKAAAQGLASAQHNLGYMYDVGLGVARDREQALHWYRKAAAQGAARSQVNLAVVLALGGGDGAAEALGWIDAAVAALTGPDREQALRARAEILARLGAAEDLPPVSAR